MKLLLQRALLLIAIIAGAQIESAALEFAVQPRDAHAPLGGAVRFYGSAAMNGKELSELQANYQWALNGIDIPFATNRILTIRNFGLLDAGDYTLRAAHNNSNVTSRAAKLTFFESLTVKTALAVQLEIPTVAGRNYRLITSSNLEAWTPDPDYSFIGTGATNVITLPASRDRAAYFMVETEIDPNGIAPADLNGKSYYISGRAEITRVSFTTEEMIFEATAEGDVKRYHYTFERMTNTVRLQLRAVADPSEVAELELRYNNGVSGRYTLSIAGSPSPELGAFDHTPPPSVAPTTLAGIPHLLRWNGQPRRLLISTNGAFTLGPVGMNIEIIGEARYSRIDWNTGHLVLVSQGSTNDLELFFNTPETAILRGVSTETGSSAINGTLERLVPGVPLGFSNGGELTLRYLSGVRPVERRFMFSPEGAEFETSDGERGRYSSHFSQGLQTLNLEWTAPASAVGKTAEIAFILTKTTPSTNIFFSANFQTQGVVSHYEGTALAMLQVANLEGRRLSVRYGDHLGAPSELFTFAAETFTSDFEPGAGGTYTLQRLSPTAYVLNLTYLAPAHANGDTARIEFTLTTPTTGRHTSSAVFGGNPLEFSGPIEFWP